MTNNQLKNQRRSRIRERQAPFSYMVIKMKNFSVHVDSVSYDCDCCGSVFSSTATVKLGDEEFEFHHDGHFGGGYWNGEHEHLLMFMISKVIGSCGYKIEHEEYSHFVGCETEEPFYCTFELTRDYVVVSQPCDECENGGLYISVNVSDLVDDYSTDWYYRDDEHMERLLNEVCEIFGVEYPTFTSNYENF